VPVERAVHLTLVVLASIGAFVGSFGYPGSPAAFWTFHGSWVLFTWLASRPPYRYGVLALAAFFFLGFWLKLLVHLVADISFIEPIGRFDGSAERWDSALWIIAAAFLGGALARALDVWRNGAAADNAALTPRVPALFVRHRLAVWTVTMVVTAGFIVWNIFGAFLMIGVTIRTLLPLRLHMLVAFWLLFGSSAWIALLLSWERALRGRLEPSWIFVAAAEGLLASISMLSRSVYLFRLFPYVLVLVTRPDVIRRPGLPRAAVGTMLLTGGLAASVGASIFTRAWIFPPGPLRSPVASVASARAGGPQAHGASAAGAATGAATEATKQAAKEAAAEAAKQAAARQREQALFSQRRQVPRLLVGRWVGLEGVLATSSDTGRGAQLFRTMLTEHPSRGVDSVYQRVSRSTYTKQEGFTFLTLAGIVGILASSGSAIVAGLGMFAVIAALTLLDGLALRMTGSALVAASVGVGAANLVAQMNFPYNTAVLFGEMVVMLLIFGALTRVLPEALLPKA
jgi:hypothetical protein